MVKKKFVRLICNNFYNVSSLYSKALYPNVANNCTVERKKQLVRFQMFSREMCFVRRLIFPKDNNQRLKHKSCSVDLSRRKHPECYRAGGSAMKVALTQQPARSLFSGYFLNLGGLAFTRRISARNHVQRNVPLNAVIILDTRQPITLIESPGKTLQQFPALRPPRTMIHWQREQLTVCCSRLIAPRELLDRKKREKEPRENFLAKKFHFLADFFRRNIISYLFVSV